MRTKKRCVTISFLHIHRAATLLRERAIDYSQRRQRVQRLDLAVVSLMLDSQISRRTDHHCFIVDVAFLFLVAMTE